jgi:hypothetical protein
MLLKMDVLPLLGLPARAMVSDFFSAIVSRVPARLLCRGLLACACDTEAGE